MITVNIFKDKKVAVFGLGKAGEASVVSLLAGGAEVFCWDDKFLSKAPYEGDFAAKFPANDKLKLSNYNSWPFASISALILAPGIAKTHNCARLAAANNVPIIGDIELLYQAQPEAHYIAITGTNGKSTTTTLIGHILKTTGALCEVGGNLGNAALTLNMLGKSGAYVLELSSYQLDLVRTTRFNTAVLLNITPDHLERHGDMAGYIAAKKHIFDRQQHGDVAIIAVDDEYTREIAKEIARKIASGENKIRLIKVSAQSQLADGIYVEDGILHDRYSASANDLLSYDISGISSLTGRHNWQNAAVAYAVARAQGIPAAAIIEAMRSFPGLRHRLQLVATIKGVRFINDSKATNADATQHALAPYRNIYWIAGGKPKSGGIESLAPFFPHIAHAYLIGEAEESFAATLASKVAYSRCKTLENAVRQAAVAAFSEGKQDAVVLLSPACASFDQFTSFEHRGDVFCQLVEDLWR